MRNTKQGISLIVLVITIIVMIILAATIIISLENTGIIKTAHNAVCMTNIKQAQNLAVLVWSNIYTNPDEYTMDNVEDKLKAEFEKNGLKYEDYNVEVTKNGINVSSKAGCTDSSGVEGGNGGNNSQVVDPSWTHAYAYSKSADAWTYIVNEGTEPTGDAIARFYVTDTIEEEFEIEKQPSVTLTLNRYKMIISGTGEFDFSKGSAPEGGYIENADYSIVSLNLVEELEVQEGITSLGRCVAPYSGSLEMDSMLENVKLPSSLKTIGDNTFIECGSLKQIIIPEGVTRIGESAFEYCYSLESVDLPDSLLTIGPDAFNSCESLKEVKLPKNLTTLEAYTEYPGHLDGAFANCSSLTKINIPSKVTSWKQAFNGCDGLKEIIIEYGVTIIDENAFRYCNLENAVMIIPTSVTTIEGAYYEVNSMTIKYKGTEEQWNAIAGADVFPTGVTVEYNYTGN